MDAWTGEVSTGRWDVAGRWGVGVHGGGRGGWYGCIGTRFHCCWVGDASECSDCG